MNDPDALKKGAIASAAYDTLLQFSLRILSFILNAFILRQISSEVFAVMVVRLHLLYATGLLLSREAFRRAALSSKGNTNIQKVINLVWIGTVVSLPVCLFGSYVWLYVIERPPETVTTNYSAGVFFICFSVLIEVASEVPFVLAELQLWSKTKVVIEGLMQLLRSLLLAISVYLWPGHAVLMYGIGHLLGSILYFCAYYGLFIYIFSKKVENTKLLVQNPWHLLPRREGNNLLPEIDPELGSLSWGFFKQGWLKEALTEGELYLMNFFPLISLAQQGMYQVVSNLGSLAARLIFRSIEAAAYKYFAQMVYRGRNIRDQDQVRVSEVSRFLSSLLRSLALVSLVIVAFGWSYSHLLLKMYGGSRLSDGGGAPLMRAQCFYVVFLAINGIMEAYTFAAMDEKQLARYNYFLIVFSFIYFATAVLLTQTFGALGFVFANCINMALRIMYSVWFVHKQYKGTEYKPLLGLRIGSWQSFVFILAFLATATSEAFLYQKSNILHILVGAVCFLIVAFSLRWELKPLYEKALNILGNILARLVGAQENQGVKFSNVSIVNFIHSFLYGEDKVKRS